jgi:multidrug resistance efflux pump
VSTTERALHGAEAGEDLDWSSLAGSSERAAFCRAWLNLQVRTIQQLGDTVTAGIVLLAAAEAGRFRPVAIWPNAHLDVTYLSQAAEQALREGRGLVIRADKADGASHIAYPLEVGGQLHGVVALDVGSTSERSLQRALRALHWGAGRLEVLLARGDTAKVRGTISNLVLNLDLVTVLAEHREFSAATRAAATELATRLAIDRVAIGFTRHGNAKVEALSHSSEFKAEANVVRAIGAAMDEAIDQQQRLLVPPSTERSAAIARATENLVLMNGGGSVCVLPLAYLEVSIGALVCESSREDAFDVATVALLEAVAALLGPLLGLHQANARSLKERIQDAAAAGAQRVVGRGHWAWKLAGGAAMLLLGLMIFVHGEHRLTADAVLEGRVVRALVAPFDSYVATAEVKAGDLVRAGQIVCTLDDRDLSVERQRLLSRRQQLLKELREAEAERNWAKVGIAIAQREQADAELALLEDRLSRTRIAAPFDGVVVSGDLSQSLAAPVQRGEVLFEVAPLDEYRVALQVDERDIDYLEVGQHGRLALASMPRDELPLIIEVIVPVTTTEDGRNIFRVEASLPQSHERLRPGMEGVAKIGVGERQLLWIWTHRITDWLRLLVWTWWP